MNNAEATAAHSIDMSMENLTTKNSMVRKCIQENLIVADDLGLFEADFLHRCLALSEYGLTPSHFAAVLEAANPATKSRFLDSLSSSEAKSLLDGLEKNLRETPSSSALVEDVLREYFWHIVYRKYPRAYETFSSHQRFDFEKLFPRLEWEGLDVADIGCGSGKLSRYLCEGARSVACVDGAVPILEIAQEKLSSFSNVTFAYGTFDHTGLAAGSFDMVASNLAFPSSGPGGGHKAIAEIRRLLRPGGCIRLTLANDSARSTLLDAGFTERIVEDALYYEPVIGELDSITKTLMVDAYYVPSDLGQKLAVYTFR